MSLAKERYIAVVSLRGAPLAYQGMDGLILFSRPTAQEFEQVRSGALPNDYNPAAYDAMTFRQLHLKSDRDSAQGETEHFLGWDVGYLSDYNSVYSLIVHYLLNNRPDGPTSRELNKNCLLSSREAALQLLDEWRAWKPVVAGDKETFEPDDELGAWGISKFTPPVEDRPATWTVKWP